MKNLADILKQAKEMQSRMAQIQEEMARTTAVGRSGGGMVEVVLNGKQEVQKLKIDRTIVNPDDVEMLEDLIVAALNDGQRKVQEMSKESLGKLTGGLDLSGMKLPF